MNTFIWPLVFLILPLPFFIRLIFKPVEAHTETPSALRVPFFDRVYGLSIGSGFTPARWQKWALILAWICFVIAGARPAFLGDPVPVSTEGRNILLTLDVSGSMREKDFDYGGIPVSRLQMVKAVVSDFLVKRQGDNVGIVVFGSRAAPYVPLSFDLKTVKSLVDEIGVGMVGEQTAIGDALAVSVREIMKVPAESRMIILLSDGVETAGSVSIPRAIELAKKEGIKVYTIGIGPDEAQRSGFFALMGAGSELDEKTLREIAVQTGGSYFRAKSTADLENIYQTIDQMEKITGKDQFVQLRRELFYYPLILGLLFLWMTFWRGRRI